jgi:dipeptide transport system ATP-binding protein
MNDLLTIRNLQVTFGGTQAVDRIDLSVKPAPARASR